MQTRILFLTLLFVASGVFAQDQKIRLEQYNLESKLALQGYDPVAYFTKNAAIKGRKEFASSYRGVVYYFSSAENKGLFAKDPPKYEPQYGGWCAFAMGDYAEKVEVDPKTFKIINGKLYLFYNKYLNNTLKSWNKNEAQLMKNANANWTNVIK